jgi:hypothetical protein
LIKLTIECHPEVFEILSDHYRQITPIADRLEYTFEEYMTDILTEESKRIKQEYRYQNQNQNDNNNQQSTD